MIIIKILAIIIYAIIGFLQIGLEYIWKDRRTKAHRKIRLFLILLMTISVVSAVSLVVYDDRNSKNQIETLNSLLKISEKAVEDGKKVAIEAENRELKAQNDRKIIQNELDEIKNQIEPFLDLATTKYPDLSIDKALEKISEDIKTLEDNLKKSKSTIHSFSAEIAFYIEADWLHGKVPVDHVMYLDKGEPAMKIYIQKASGDSRNIDLKLEGSADIEEEGNFAVFSYRTKAFPKSWIFGQDLRDIVGYHGPIFAYLFELRPLIVPNTKIIIRRTVIEIEINNQTVARFDKTQNVEMNLSGGISRTIGVEFNTELIKSSGTLGDYGDVH